MVFLLQRGKTAVKPLALPSVLWILGLQIECGNAGFAAFLLYTLDHILFCRAVGINRPTVFWRAGNSDCSRDPRVNSWDWYFEPVNRGLESEVENVFCLLRPDCAPVDVGTTIDNSFKNRTDIEGFELSRITTTQERIKS